jgi:mono/diheme cytochrome c family protein
VRVIAILGAEFPEWKNDLRHWLIVLNIIAVAFLIYFLIKTILSPRSQREDGNKSPANLTPFLPDEDLEGRRLERVQGWALIFAAVVAVSLPIYWLREPTRSEQSVNYFDRNAVARGAVLYANSASPEYNSSVSLQCANCHGQEGVGGVAPATVDGKPVAWKAPPLNTVMLRFTEQPECSNEQQVSSHICEVTSIITYGRPGTPMQPWGVVGGGPKNAQSIADLVAYLRSITLSPDEARKEADAALAAARSSDPDVPCPEYVTCPNIESENAKTALDAADKALADASAAAAKALKLPATATPTEINDACTAVIAEVEAATEPITGDVREQALACGDYKAAKTVAANRQASYTWSLEWINRRQNVSDGQILFETYCARCHTEGWSVFDPSAPPGDVDSVDILGLSGGGGGTGGGIGFNLRDGATVRRFGTDEAGGWSLQQQFIVDGSDPNKGYGIGGIGSGKMPGFGQMLTDEQIGQIVSYERYCLNTTTYTGVSPPCRTPSRAPVIPGATTTTPTTAGGGPQESANEDTTTEGG